MGNDPGWSRRAQYYTRSLYMRKGGRKETIREMAACDGLCLTLLVLKAEECRDSKS